MKRDVVLTEYLRERSQMINMILSCCETGDDSSESDKYWLIWARIFDEAAEINPRIFNVKYCFWYISVIFSLGFLLSNTVRT